MSFAWFVVGGLLGASVMYVAAKERVWKVNPVIGAPGITDEGYAYDENGVIQDPGKFQGQPRWAPAMWALVLEGSADEGLPDGTEILILDDDDYRKYPELVGVYAVALWKDGHGFFDTMELSKAELEDLMSEREDEEGY